MAKNQPVRYPCLGYCVIDSRGYCVACGRPPTLGLPEVCASPPPKASSEAGAEPSPNKAPVARKWWKPSGSKL